MAALETDRTRRTGAAIGVCQRRQPIGPVKAIDGRNPAAQRAGRRGVSGSRTVKCNRDILA